MIKYIVTDLDGTLFVPYDRKKLVSDGNVLFLQNFVNNGGKVLLCSGRDCYYAHKVMDRIGFKTDSIGVNGAVAEIDGKINERVIINNDTLDTILNIKINGKTPSTFLFAKEGLFVDFHQRIMNLPLVNLVFRLLKGGYSQYLIVGKKRFLDEVKNGTIYKVLFMIGLGKKAREKAGRIAKDLREKYPDLEIHWSLETIEISPKGCNKGAALNEYFGNLNVKKDEVLVVGDSGNDIPMFKEFYENSFVISSSPKEVKKYAKYEIDKIEDLSRYLNKK